MCPACCGRSSRYAYGCLEQTTSRALPLLYVDEVASLWQAEPGFTPAKSVDDAIGRIAGMQKSDGSFGVWNDSDDTVPWLDAYAADFLMRAKEHGKTVPDFVLKGVLGWLRDYVRQTHKDDKDLPALAYAHYVLARAKADDLGALRYFNDTQMTRAAEPARQGAAGRGAGRLWRQRPRVRRLCRGADPAAEARGCAALCRLRQRSARQRRSAGLCLGRSRQPGAADPDHGPHRRAVRQGQPHQHPGTGVAAAGGRGGGEADRQQHDRRDRQRCAADPGEAAVFAASARGRRGGGDGRQSGHGAGVAHGVGHRRGQGRAAGREQRLPGDARRLPRRTAPWPI